MIGSLLSLLRIPSIWKTMAETGNLKVLSRSPRENTVSSAVFFSCCKNICYKPRVIVVFFVQLVSFTVRLLKQGKISERALRARFFVIFRCGAPQFFQERRSAIFSGAALRLVLRPSEFSRAALRLCSRRFQRRGAPLPALRHFFCNFLMKCRPKSAKE